MVGRGKARMSLGCWCWWVRVALGFVVRSFYSLSLGSLYTPPFRSLFSILHHPGSRNPLLHRDSLSIVLFPTYTHTHRPPHLSSLYPRSSRTALTFLFSPLLFVGLAFILVPSRPFFQLCPFGPVLSLILAYVSEPECASRSRLLSLLSSPLCLGLHPFFSVATGFSME